MGRCTSSHKENIHIMEITLGDRSVIITGAGSGLGRSHALYMASRGALVAVNDLNLADAEAVVAEIREGGGMAFAFAGSVSDPIAMLQLVNVTIDEFGHLDVVVNNAGIIKDAPFHKMPWENVRIIIDVHVMGALNLLHAAWPHLRERPSARVINTSSDSGLFGNAMQANYGTAKMGLIGTTLALADEGRRNGVGVNAIVPVALTPMTKPLFEAAGITDEQLGPQWVSPVVAYLASEQCDLTGRILNAAGGYVGESYVSETRGAMFGDISELTPEAIAARLDEICDTTGAWRPMNMNTKVGIEPGGEVNLLDRLASKQ